MQKHAFALVASIASAFVLVSGVTASAQQNPSGPSDQSQSQEHRMDQDRTGRRGGGMMGPGMMGGMRRPGMMGAGEMMPPPMMMRMMFALIDADGDGTISLQEFQIAHERIFKAMDANKDGKLTLQEMQGFMRGGPPAPQQQ